MNDLRKTRLFALLSGRSQKTMLTDELENAYEDFEEDLRITCNSGDNTVIHMNLSVTRVELIFLESILQCGQGEKCA